MQAVVRVLLTLILLVAAVFLSYDLARYYLYSPWTRDARVRANVVTVAPDVSGYVDDIRVRNNQFVHKGDVLFIIDQDRYRLALADAEAALAVKHAQYLMLLDQYERRSKLSPGYTITVENLDNARRQSESAAASYQQASASRDTAALNLKRTEVRASVNGFITNLNLANGTYASQGKPVMALIDSDSYRVEAYFEETKIPHIRAGASAEIYLMDGSPAARSGFEHSKRHHGSGQQGRSTAPLFRQSRIHLGPTGAAHSCHRPPHARAPRVLVSAGMTCTVVIKEGSGPQIGLGIKKAMAALF